LLAAASILESGELEANLAARYAGWDGELGRLITGGDSSLKSLHDRAMERTNDIERASGRQEALENVVARHIERAR
ncbi:MAG: xylose isomerase, partial [Ilumatobacteraceae bacterium]